MAQKGQAIVLVALMLVVVVAMAALAIDGSRAYALRRNLQAGVDAAALAAADNFQRSGSYASAEQAASSSFGINLSLYSAPSCSPGYGSPGASGYTVTCTYSDGTTLTDLVQAQGPRGASFQFTATSTLALQFGRILTNGSAPSIAAAGAGRVNILLYSPTLAALAQNGCGGAGATAISISGSGQLAVSGDIVSNGSVSIAAGTARVAGDVYSRCQSSVGGLSTACYPSGANPACTFPDVAGAVRTGYHLADPGYPAPGPLGSAQAVPSTNVNLSAGVFGASVSLGSARCYFLGGGVYDFAAGFTNAGSLISNELKPPDEPAYNINTSLASPQFWNTTGANCAGSVQITSVHCNGSGACGTGNCGNGSGNGQGNGCAAAPPGDWSVEVTSTRTDTFGGNSYQRESAPSMCQGVHVGNNEAIQVIVSNVPGATVYNVYASPTNNLCNGIFGLADVLPLGGPVLNNSLAGCPAFTGTTCSLGFETIVLNGHDIGSPWAPNGAAAPGTLGAPPPNSERAPLISAHPNQNPARLAGAAGDRANENNCETTGGAFATCPDAVTPGAVALYLPGASCLVGSNSSDTYIFSGYQYNWVVAYEPPSNSCANVFGANGNSALIGLVYTPGASISNTSADTFDSAGTGGVIAATLSFTGNLPAITFDAGYAPVPFAARLVS